MRIFIKDIRPEGLDVDYDIGVDEVGLTDKDYMHLTQPIHVKAHIDRIENTILLKTKVNGRYKSYCSRTLVNVERDFNDEFLLDFPVDKHTEFIDPNDDIRQEAILGLPMKVLCDEEIKKDEQSKRVSVDGGDSSIEEKVRTYQPFADLKLRSDKG